MVLQNICLKFTYNLFVDIPPVIASVTGRDVLFIIFIPYATQKNPNLKTHKT